MVGFVVVWREKPQHIRFTYTTDCPKPNSTRIIRKTKCYPAITEFCAPVNPQDQVLPCHHWILLTGQSARPSVTLPSLILLTGQSARPSVILPSLNSAHRPIRKNKCHPAITEFCSPVIPQDQVSPCHRWILLTGHSARPSVTLPSLNSAHRSDCSQQWNVQTFNDWHKIFTSYNRQETQRQHTLNKHGKNPNFWTALCIAFVYSHVSALKGNLQNSTHTITGNCEDFIVGIPFKSADLLHLTFLTDIQVHVTM